VSKKEDEWLYQYPSTTVQWKIVPTGANATPYIGEANKLLYQTKNMMTFNKLDQLRSVRYLFSDMGIVAKIIAASSFGQDFIEIHVPSGVVMLMPSCNIILYNVPESIPPMNWYAPGTETFTKVDDVWVINKPDGTLEVEGIDFIKTYYSYGIDDCPDCSPLTFTVAEGENAYILTGSSPNRPFWYEAETYEADGITVKELIYTYGGIMVPHYMGEDWNTPPVPPNPLKHTIYSLWGGCQAEIIKFDGDSGGAYFLWKAYTEWSNIGPYAVEFSKSGLGYMLMQGFITNQGLTLCENDPTIIKVDCCLKPASGRLVSLWWESLTALQAGGPTCSGQSFIFYKTIKICEVPSEVAGIYVLLCVPTTPKILYAIPEIQGGCLPFEWTVSNGLFRITPSLPSGETAALEKVNCSEELTCDQGFEVTVVDRCGTTNTVRFISCCEDVGENPSLFISYTTLAMGCGQTQTLSVGGQGCGPYAWSNTGSGSLDTNVGNSVVYTAPLDNPNCGNNDTVTLTDCCGNTTTITLYVSCYTVEGLAWRVCASKICEHACLHPTPGVPGDFCHFHAVEGIWDYNCTGVAYSSTFQNYPGHAVATYDCYDSADFKWGCDDTAAYGCGNDWWKACNSACELTCNYSPLCPGASVCGNNDQRTADMKTAGCCPVDPNTGLPFTPG